MLRRVTGIHGDALEATDGRIGHVEDLLFDDAQWQIRYMVANTGLFLFGRKVLLHPTTLGSLDWNGHVLNVNLTRDKVKASPGLKDDEPVSRQFETHYYDYYEWPYYWSGLGTIGAQPFGVMGAAGVMMNPSLVIPSQHDRGAMDNDDASAYRATPPVETGDPHLRSAKEVTGYRIAARDGDLGHIEDFIFEDETWTIRHLAVDTKHWWPADKKVLLPVSFIRDVNWPEMTVTVDLTCDQIRNGPSWNMNAPITSALESELSSYFNSVRQVDHANAT